MAIVYPVNNWMPISWSPYRDYGHEIHSLTSGGSPNAAAWPLANLAIAIPFRVRVPITIQRMWVAKGGTLSGNFDVGITDRAGTFKYRAGSTAQSGSTQIPQTVTIAGGLYLPRGTYWQVLVFDNAVGQTRRWALTAGTGVLLGMAQQANAFPLPSAMTFAAFAQTYLPLWGWSRQNTITF